MLVFWDRTDGVCRCHPALALWQLRVRGPMERRLAPALAVGNGLSSASDSVHASRMLGASQALRRPVVTAATFHPVCVPLGCWD